MPLYNKEQAWEISLLALTLWREGRDQSFQAQRGIAWSIRNRAKGHTGKYWWGNDWEEVILKPWQYSSFNSGDPNATKFPGDPSTDTAWQCCLNAAEDVYNELVGDPTGGATHYCRYDLNPLPAWTQPPAVLTVQLGDHLFYKGVK